MRWFTPGELPWTRLPNYVPWSYVVIWIPFRILSGRPVFSATDGSEWGPAALVWQGVNLFAAVAIIWAARFLSARLRGAPKRLGVAVVAYLAVPLSPLVFAQFLLDETKASALLELVAGMIALSLLSAILALSISGPASDQRQQLSDLNRAREELLDTRERILTRRTRIQRDLDANIREVISPEVNKVIEFLKSGSFGAGFVDRLVSDIHHSVEVIVKPFSRKLLADTSRPFTKRPRPNGAVGGLAGWSTPVSISGSIHPFAVASVMFAFLIAIYLRDQLAPGWDTVRIALFSLVIGSVIVVALKLMQWLFRRRPKAHPVAVVVTIWGIQYLLGLIAITGVTRFPRDIFDYDRWGLPDSFPNALALVAVYTLAVSISGILSARRQDFIEQTQSIESQIRHEISLLNTDVWHLRRQGALFVHGRIQSALIATGLQLQQKDLEKDDVFPLIKRLEEALSSIQTSDEDLMLFEEFLDSLATMWTGVAEISYTVSATAIETMSTSKTTEDAVREVIRESVNNGIFHGGASMITIALDQLRPNVTRLTVEDNGKGPISDPNAGLGSRLMDIVTLNWELRKGSPQTILEADFASPSTSAVGPVLST